ncbi:MAG: glycosyl hydrolase family 65 protein [Phycisphaerae bacterium]
MSWTIRESDLPNQEPDFLSTIFTVGNGHTCTRGTLSEEGVEAFRGMYVSGLYTRAGYGLNYFLSGPDWLQARPVIGGRQAQVESSSRELDMKRGLLRRTAVFGNSRGKVEFIEERFCSLKFLTLLAQRITVRILEGDAAVEIVMGIDGDVRNHQAKYFKPGQMPNATEHGLKLSEIESIGMVEDCPQVTLVSPQTDTRVMMVSALMQTEGDQLQRVDGESEGLVGSIFQIPAGSAGKTFAFDKLCRFVADVEPHAVTRTDLPRFIEPLKKQDFETALADHVGQWQEFWDVADVRIEGDADAQRAVRFAIWSTRITAPCNGGLSSVGAKNLTGDWYRGAVFWDMELYQFPLLAAVAPELARNHLLYRYNRLGSARVLAAQDGYKGARFPWHSYKTGLEEPPVFGGFLYQQQHINVGIPWSAFHYYELTGDAMTMLEAGLELVLDQCRFWVSRVEPAEDGTYHITNVCGPDEVHQGIADNAYTNRMVVWLLRRAWKLIDELRHIDTDKVNSVLIKLGLSDADRHAWADVADNLHVPTIEQSGVFAQFEGFGSEPEPSGKLGGGKDKTNKQADTLMLFQAIPYEFSTDTLANCFNTYAPLCNQTSSLSMCTHALLAGRLGLPRDVTKYFRAAAGVDLDDSYGNTRHGIHGAGQGGIWLAIVHGFGGLTVGDDGVAIRPRLPLGWDALEYSVLIQDQRVEVRVRREGFSLTNHGEQAVNVLVPGEDGTQRISLPAGQTKPVDHQAEWAPDRLQGVIVDMDAIPAESQTAEWLENLHGAGIKSAVVSEQGGAPEKLFEMGLGDGFNAIVDSEILSRFGEDPQRFYIAAQHLRLIQWNCLAIVASDDAAMSARAAGMAAVRVGDTHELLHLTPESLQKAFVDSPVDSNPYFERNLAKVRAEEAEKA